MKNEIKKEAKKKVKKNKVKATDLALVNIARDKEMVKERSCPICKKPFFWTRKREGQVFCSRDCFLVSGKGGRPAKITNEVLNKLRYAFLIGCTNKQACDYAGISETTLSNYERKNPKFKLEKEALKGERVFRARIKVFSEIESNIEIAKWVLEKLQKDEFGNKLRNNIVVFNGEVDEEHLKVARKYLKGIEDEDEEDDEDEE